MAKIDLRDVSKIYSDGSVRTVALKNVSLKITPGEFLAIMGPSGSGKSTLLHIIGLLDTPTSGQYFLADENVADAPGSKLAKIRNNQIGFVFQFFNLLPRITSLENVKLPLLYSNFSESEWLDRAEKALNSVGLSERMKHLPTELSGGERQRVAIARALVTNPKIILADEPTGNLDSKSGQVIMNILQDLNRKYGHTIILITHETYTAEHADRIIKLHDGQLVSDEKVKEKRSAENNFEK